MKKSFLLGALAVLIAAAVSLFLWAVEPSAPAAGGDVASTNAERELPRVGRGDIFETPPLAASAKGAAVGADDEIFAGGVVVCDSCDASGEKLELRDIPDVRGRIARILESMKESNGMRDCDPRVAQLVALGDGAVDDLLEAFDAVNAESAAGGGSRGAARGHALQFALDDLLTEKDKEIILTNGDESC